MPKKALSLPRKILVRMIPSLVALLLVCFVMFFITSAYQPLQIALKAPSGTLTRFVDEAVPRIGEMSDIEVTDSRIYLTWDGQHVTRVYDLDGSYLYSWYFPDSTRNGAMKSWAVGDSFYLCTAGNDVYCCVVDELTEAWLGDAGRDKYWELRSANSAERSPRKQIVRNGVQYQIRGVDVYRTENDVTVKLINNPDICAIFNPIWMWYGTVGAIVLLILICQVDKWLMKREDRKQEKCTVP